MLLLVFEAGAGRYGLDVRDVLEVAAFPGCREVPRTPPYVLGLVNYRGEATPVVDVSALLTGGPAGALLSTRLVFVRSRCGERQRAVGLVVERAVETVSCDEREMKPAPLSIAGGPRFRGAVAAGGGLIHCISAEGLLPEELRAMLFAAGEAG
ncbi:MAG: purine-binding chemotaxis protein CheW [Bryobacteraceae bacterium]|nr:purine-binding chemotaxis protein CheW [Bryobacteraceae bacterium]